jgi:hypothetical protein
MRQLLEAISTRERLRAFWQRNLVTLAMLRRNLPDLKMEKGEHYAEILTSLYKQQMRAVWEEAKTDARRTRELAGRSETRKVRDQGTQENGQLSSALEKAPEGLNTRVPETKHSQPTERQGASGGELVRQSHRNGVPPEASPAIGTDVSPKGRAKNPAKGDDTNGAPGHVDKTKLPISVPRRIRDKEHLRYVASQPCIICGRSPGHAHHLRFAQPRALGQKVSDEWTVPLCSTHHRALHSVGDEKQWWREKGIDPIVHAVRLWWDTRHGGVEHLSQMAEAGSSIVFAGSDGPPAAGKKSVHQHRRQGA